MKTQTLSQIREDAIASSVYRPASVTQEPHTTLTQWQAFKVSTDDGQVTNHFMGYTGYEGRVCSGILEYDNITRKGITKSGRIYELIGTSGFNKDAMYVFSIWCSRFPKTTVFENISEQYE